MPRWQDRSQSQTNGAARPGTGPPAQMKVIQMTATAQPRHPLTRWATALIRAFRHLNQELLGAQEAMVRSSRFPQPRPQAEPAQAAQVQPASGDKVLTGV
jgi:hypothetical protein